VVTPLQSLCPPQLPKVKESKIQAVLKHPILDSPFHAFQIWTTNKQEKPSISFAQIASSEITVPDRSTALFGTYQNSGY
jgi:hypothetical protein